MNSLSPEIWGPSFWKTIHYVSLGYPDNPSNQDKKNYAHFYNSLDEVLPCLQCAINYKDHLKEHPLSAEFLKNPQTLFLWTVKLHNIVNRTLNKPQLLETEALEMYSGGSTLNCKKWFRRACMFFNLALIIYMAYYFFYKKYKNKRSFFGVKVSK